MWVGKAAVAAVVVSLVQVTSVAATPDWHTTLRHGETHVVVDDQEDLDIDAVDLAPDGSLYVVDSATESLRVAAADGSVTAAAGAPGDALCSAVGSDGSIYVGTVAGLWRIDPAGTAAQVGDLSWVNDVAADPAGGVFVATERRVEHVDAAGATRTVLEDAGEPTNLAVDSTGYLFVTVDVDAEPDLPDQLLMIGPDGTRVTLIEATTPSFTGEGAALSEAGFGEWLGGIAIGVDDALYIADSGNGFVRRVSPATSAGTVTTIGPAVSSMTDIDVSADGTVYAASDGQVVAFADTDRLAAAQVDEQLKPGSDPLADAEPGTRLAIVPADSGSDLDELASQADGSLLVARSTDGRSGPELIRIDGQGATGPVSGAPDRVLGVAALADGSAIVWTGSVLERVFPDGATAQVTGYGGHEVGGAELPALIAAFEGGVSPFAAGPDGSLYVADQMADVIYRIDSAGLLTTFVDDVNVDDLAVGPDGTLYLCEDGATVRSVNPEGEVAEVYAPEGYADVGDLAIAPDGTVYVAEVDQEHRRVVRVGDDGETVVILDEVEPSGLSSGSTIAVDPHGNLVVGSLDDESIELIAKPGQLKPFPVAVVTATAAGVGVVGIAGFLVWRLRRRGRPQGESSL